MTFTRAPARLWLAILALACQVAMGAAVPREASVLATTAILCIPAHAAPTHQPHHHAHMAEPAIASVASHVQALLLPGLPALPAAPALAGIRLAAHRARAPPARFAAAAYPTGPPSLS